MEKNNQYSKNFIIIFVLCWFGMGGVFCLIGYLFNILFLFIVGIVIEIIGIGIIIYIFVIFFKNIE